MGFVWTTTELIKQGLIECVYVCVYVYACILCCVYACVCICVYVYHIWVFVRMLMCHMHVYAYLYAFVLKEVSFPQQINVFRPKISMVRIGYRIGTLQN